MTVLSIAMFFSGSKSIIKPTVALPSQVSKLSPLFISDEVFEKSIATPKNYPATVNAVAGVVPHHLTADSLIAGFFQSISGGSYNTVIILAPNHFGRSGDIVTSLLDWNTYNGGLLCDTTIEPEIAKLSNFDVKLNNATVQNDHSASNMVPYIQHYLHGAKVAPLLLSNRITLDMSKKLAEKLYKISRNKKVLVLCSIDFSHYLTAYQATQKDSITRTAIKNFDIPRISVMGNSYLDCPPALMIFLFYCQLQAAPVTILDNSNSSVLLNEDSQSVTSYFILRAGVH